MYGDQLREHASESSLCIIVQKITQFFFFPLELFSTTLTFYLWYALARNDFTIEQKYCRWVSIAIWGFNAIYQVVRLGFSSKLDDWGVEADRLHCKATSLMQNWLSFLITTSIMTFFAVIFTPKHSRRFARTQNRGTAVKLGEAVRLLVCSLVFVALLLASSVPRIVKRANSIPDSEKLTIAEYTGSIVGIALFLVFGTRHSAALLLPCFYYEPTESYLIKNTVKLQNIRRKENDNSHNRHHSTSNFERTISLKKPLRSIIRKGSKQYLNNKKISKTLILENNFSSNITTPNPSPRSFLSETTTMTQMSELSFADEWYVSRSDDTVIKVDYGGEV
ncbi:2465_t:CDS:2 [Ambispora gerdemannii]|uniref:2465_t:CDS:1 n=1 Tax=Ambispora gerdemannii TaxID=144530 RepID=A0A9N9AL99_9GLOM|nr:2465_t:CDS:2 [Ambispora gerdemannii]